jgi:hypothetical protein
MKRFYSVNMIERNIEFIDNFELVEKKRSLDKVLHNLKCEEAYRRALQLQI